MMAFGQTVPVFGGRRESVDKALFDISAAAKELFGFDKPPGIFQQPRPVSELRCQTKIEAGNIRKSDRPGLR